MLICHPIKALLPNLVEQQFDSEYGHTKVDHDWLLQYKILVNVIISFIVKVKFWKIIYIIYVQRNLRIQVFSFFSNFTNENMTDKWKTFKMYLEQKYKCFFSSNCKISNTIGENQLNFSKALVSITPCAMVREQCESSWH